MSCGMGHVGCPSIVFINERLPRGLEAFRVSKVFKGFCESCGIIDFMPTLIQDIKNKIYMINGDIMPSRAMFICCFISLFGRALGLFDAVMD